MSEMVIPFNDEFVGGRVKDLLSLKIDRHVITNEQFVKVFQILELVDNSVAQLQAKRNSVVKLLTEDDHDDAAWATMSGVTCVIDSCLMSLGVI